MKLSILLATVLTVSMAWSQQRPPVRPSGAESEILDLTREINQTVRSGQLSRQELEDVRAQLRDVVDSMYGAPSTSKVICSKQSNALFYPTSLTGTIIGSSSSAAGYYSLEDCRATLPARGERLTCFKQSNALFYPANSETGSIVGSSSSAAGYYAINDCRSALPKRRASIACFKQSNALFYPANPETGAIIGSSSSAAGYRDLSSCLKVIEQ